MRLRRSSLGVLRLWRCVGAQGGTRCSAMFLWPQAAMGNLVCWTAVPVLDDCVILFGGIPPFTP